MRSFIKYVLDGFDARDVDKHILAIVTLSFTYVIVKWSMGFAESHADKPGIEIAAILGAINAPYMALQAAVVKFYFESRPDTPLDWDRRSDPPSDRPTR